MVKISKYLVFVIMSVVWALFHLLGVYNIFTFPYLFMTGLIMAIEFFLFLLVTNFLVVKFSERKQW